MNKETTVSLHKNEKMCERYYEIHHKSGLNIYVFPKQMSITYALFATRYGSVDNCFRLEGNREYEAVPDGIAHFLEHKMFESADGTDTFERFAAIGASANAFTTNDMTAYEFSCTERIYDALAILLDYVTHPHFTKENVAKEQGIIAQEIQMCEDNPMRRLYQELLNALYINDPTRMNICGTADSIAKITPEHLYKCYNTFYQLSNMALVICGDVTEDAVIDVADKVLQGREDAKIERYFEAEPCFVAKKRAEIFMDVSRPLFGIGIKDICVERLGETALRHTVILHIIADLLFSDSGEFFNDMYDEGLLNQCFGGGYETTHSGGFFMLWGETDEPETVYDRIIECIEKNKVSPPTREDFIRIKRAHYASYVRGFDSTDVIANELLVSLFDDVDFFRIGDVIDSITYEETIEKIKTFFKAEAFSMATILPMGDKTC